MKSLSKGYLLMIISGTFYGFIGIFVSNLSNYNIPTSVIAFFRPLVAFIVIFTYLLIFKREYLKVDRKNLIYIILIAISSQTIFNRLYFAAIEKTTITTAAVMIFTSPIFVVILARFIYKELFTLPKMIALVVAVTGCFLTSTGGSIEELKLNAVGLALGLGAGFTFAFLPIFNKKLVGKCHYLTIACYTMGFGALFTFLLAGPQAVASIDYNLNLWVNIIGLGIIGNALGYLFYTAAMSYNIQSSMASIIVTIEVPIAALTSFIFFQEDIFGIKLLGIILVILSVAIIEYGDRWFLKRKEKAQSL